MKINKDNYEAYLLDLYEGTCSSEDEALLRQFIQDHPDLNIEVELDLPLIQSAPEAFEDKIRINRSNANPDLSIQELIIAVLEGDASKEEQIELTTLCEQSKSVAKEKAHIERCYLKIKDIEFTTKASLRDASDDELSNEETTWAASHEGDGNVLKIDRQYILGVPKVTYPHKADLKKKEKVVAMWWYSAAALAAMFILAVFIFQNKPESISARALADIGAKKSINLPITSFPVKEKLPAEDAGHSAGYSAGEKASTQALADNGIVSRVQLDVPQMMSSKPIEAALINDDVNPSVVLIAQSLPRESMPRSNTENAWAANDNNSGSSGFINLREFLGFKIKERLELSKNSSTNETVMALATQARQSLNKSTRDQTPLLKNKKTDNSKAISLQIGRFSYERN